MIFSPDIVFSQTVYRMFTQCLQKVKVKGKGICLESRYPRFTFSSDFTFPRQRAPTAACSYRSNLGSVHQVPITAGWTEAVWNTKFVRHFYTWPALGIEPQTFWSWVQCPIHLATCSHNGIHSVYTEFYTECLQWIEISVD